MSFARGFQVGWSAVDEALKEREKQQLREGLKRAGALEPTQQTVADPQLLQALQQAGDNPETGLPYYTVRDGYVQPNFAVETTAAMPAGPDQITPGVGPDQIPVVQPGARGIESRLAPAEAVRIPETTQYQLGGLTRETPFTQSEIQRARTEEMARVYEQQGMPEEAMRMRQLAQQQELTSLQLDEQRYKTNQRKAREQLSTLVTEARKSGTPLSADQLFDLSQRAGADTDTLRSVAESTFGVNKQVYDNNILQRQQLAQGVTTLSGAINLYNTNPLFADGSTMRAQPQRDGTVVISQIGQDGQPVFTSEPVSEGQALAYLKQRITDPAAAEQFALTVAEKNSNILKNKALVKLYNDRSKAEGLDPLKFNDVRQYYTTLSEDIARDQERLATLTPDTSEYRALERKIQTNIQAQSVAAAKLANQLSPPKGSATPVGETITVRGQVFRKAKEGPDSDGANWEPVEGGAAAPARGLTPGAAPAAREQAPAPAGIERMGQRIYGRLTPDAVVAEGARRGDPSAIAEQRRRQEIEAARGAPTPGYNQLGVF